MLEVTQAKYQDGYKIWLEFNDGLSGVVDLSEALWGQMFEPLKNIEQFRQFGVSGVLHTLAWENGADLSPEYLHEKLAAQLSQPSPCNQAG
jgi:hypothetical protein